jgi:hypothetical protein
MARIRAVIAAVTFFSASLLGFTAAQAQGVELFAVLLGGNEVTGPLVGDRQGDPRAGDLDGFGTASVIIISNSELCFNIAVDNLTQAVAAHIHRGPAGVNGGIVVNLAPPVAPGASNPGVSAGCVGGLAAALLNDIRLNPSLYYVNVHTGGAGGFPNGALRGQLF